MSADGQGPLAGFRVVDLSANMTGPYATELLAEQGAAVVKIEPHGGEVIRRIGTGRDGLSAYFANLNRSKQSVVMDLHRPEAIALVKQLVAGADVVVQNFRPGVVEQLGLGPDELCAEFPQLVYLSISGFGRSGPLAGAPAYDNVVQALSGMAERNVGERAGGPPSLVRHGIVDKLTGMFAAQAITAALLRRSRTGRGGRVEVSMLDAAIHFLWPDGMMNETCLDADIVQQPSIAAAFRLTETADGFVALVTVTDKQWTGLMRVAGLDELLDDPDFATITSRMRNAGRAMRKVGVALREMSTAEVLRRTAQHDVPCMPALGLDQVRHHEQVIASATIEELDHPVLGRIAQPRPAARFVDEERPPIIGVGQPGHDTDVVLQSLGLSPAAIEDLRARKVVA